MESLWIIFIYKKPVKFNEIIKELENVKIGSSYNISEITLLMMLYPIMTHLSQILMKN